MHKPPQALPTQQAHDVQRWGPLRAALPGKPPLTRYVDLVRAAMVEHGLAQAEAAAEVLARSPAGGVFLLNREGPATRIVEPQQIGVVHIGFVQALLTGESETQRFVGPDGALAYLRWLWIAHGDADTDLEASWDPYLAPRGGAFAVLVDDAEAMRAQLSVQFVRAQSVAELPACGPPEGFKKDNGWTPEFRAGLLRQFSALRDAGLTYEGALVELHKAWGYSKNPERNGGPLGKVLTVARREANAMQRPTKERG